MKRFLRCQTIILICELAKLEDGEDDVLKLLKVYDDLLVFIVDCLVSSLGADDSIDVIKKRIQNRGF